MKRSCQACGAVYGQPGTRCYPGVSDLVAAQMSGGERAGVPGYCARGRTQLGVPWPTHDQVVAAVRQIRAAGASWDIVARTLARFRLRIPPGIQDQMRPTVRGQWPPEQPEPTSGGPRPPVRLVRPPLPPGGPRPWDIDPVDRHHPGPDDPG
jgi:hypothetical protein